MIKTTLVAAVIFVTTAARAADTRSVGVHISGDPRLELRLAGGGAVVCRAPCDRAVEVKPGRAYEFGGQGIAPSAQFGFDDGKDFHWFWVKAADDAALRRGKGLIVGA